MSVAVDRRRSPVTGMRYCSWRRPAPPTCRRLGRRSSGQFIAFSLCVELGHSGNSPLSAQRAGGDGAVTPWPPGCPTPATVGHPLRPHRNNARLLQLRPDATARSIADRPTPLVAPRRRYVRTASGGSASRATWRRSRSGRGELRPPRWTATARRSPRAAAAGSCSAPMTLPPRPFRRRSPGPPADRPAVRRQRHHRRRRRRGGPGDPGGA
jgi:hypothetical protein